MAMIREFAEERGCDRVALGRNFWARIEPELTGVKTFARADGTELGTYSPPFQLGWSRGDPTRRLADAGWSDRIKEIAGLITNCRVPGMVGKIFAERTGIHPEIPLLSNEVVCAFISREAALRELSLDDVEA
jgi:hypothetical protein